MSWKELLTKELQSAYSTTEKLMAQVDDGALNWKPATGANWMTTGQLLKHLTEACGVAFRGFITGDWGLPPGVDMSEMGRLPSAEELPSIGSVAEAKSLLEADKKLSFEMLATRDECSLAKDKAPAPWDPTEMPLGHRLLTIVEHLKQHKGQLFYYLKLQGKAVNTGDLWGL